MTGSGNILGAPDVEILTTAKANKECFVIITSELTQGRSENGAVL